MSKIITLIVVSANTKRRHDFRDKNFSGFILHQHTIKMSYDHYKHMRRRYIDAGLSSIANILWNRDLKEKKLKELIGELLYNRQYIKETLEPSMYEITKLLITATTQALLGQGIIKIIYENTKKR